MQDKAVLAGLYSRLKGLLKVTQLLGCVRKCIEHVISDNNRVPGNNRTLDDDELFADSRLYRKDELFVSFFFFFALTREQFLAITSLRNAR